MTYKFPKQASLYAFAIGLSISASDTVFAGKPLTAYEQNLVCKLSGTCDTPAGNPAKPGTAAPAGTARDVGQEAAFSVYQGNNKSVTAGNPATSAPLTSRNGLVTSTGPRAKFGGAVGQSSHRPRNYGYGADGSIAPGRKNAADVRVLFANGSAEMDAHGMAEISHFAHALAAPELSTKHFVVEGHTNSVGGRDYNLALSQQRAQTVVDYLVKQGVDPTRLQAKGFGFDQPRLPDSKAGGNRRVEVVKAD